MPAIPGRMKAAAITSILAIGGIVIVLGRTELAEARGTRLSPVVGEPARVTRAAGRDVSAPLRAMMDSTIDIVGHHSGGSAAGSIPPMSGRPQQRRADVEQRSAGTRPSAAIIASFDGLGIGFEGPQGPGRSGNPSDNSLAVGPNHIVQTVNSRMAIFTKKGATFDTTGKVLYGSVPTNNVFRGFTGTCDARNNGDAVVRYDQLADRWLIVMPIFSRSAPRPDQPSAHSPRDGARPS